MIRRKIIPRQRKGRGWYVCIPYDFRSPSSPQRCRFFGTGEDGRADADAYAKQLTEARKSHGDAFLTLPIWQQNELLRMAERIGWSNLKSAADMFEERKPLSRLGIPQVAADCLKEKIEVKRIRKESQDYLKWTFKSFGDHCTKPIGNITTADVESWRDAHPNWSPKTICSQLINLNTLFNYAIRKKMITANPCADVQRPLVPIKAKQILAVADIEKLLHTCQKHDVAFLGWLAPVVLGGLRGSEGRRLLKANVTSEVIDMDDGRQTKRNDRRAFELSPVLKRFLAVKGVKFQSLTKRQASDRLAKVCKLAGVKVPKNALRKSCASYWVKLKKAKEASGILGTSEAMLEKNYANNRVTMDDAKRFEALRPYSSSQT